MELEILCIWRAHTPLSPHVAYRSIFFKSSLPLTNYVVYERPLICTCFFQHSLRWVHSYKLMAWPIFFGRVFPALFVLSKIRHSQGFKVKLWYQIGSWKSKTQKSWNADWIMKIRPCPPPEKRVAFQWLPLDQNLGYFPEFTWWIFLVPNFFILITILTPRWNYKALCDQ